MIKELIEKDQKINELQQRIEDTIEYLKENETIFIQLLGTYYYKLLEKIENKEDLNNN